LTDAVGQVAVYGSKIVGDRAEPPLLLVHSVNAAASAYEVRPLYNHYASHRSVYALELPGFGHSERSDKPYTVRLMTDAVVLAARHLRQKHGMAIDAVGLSLSCEFLARAAVENPDLFRSLGLISPTGFEGKARDQAGGTRAKPWLRQALACRLWDSSLFALFSAKPIIRKFLEKTWGSKQIDEGLLAYDYQTAHQPGAQHAPYYFVSGYLFAEDALRLYETLSLPVWMVRGTRGDFVDYHHTKHVAARANWRLEVLDSGAFPQFETLAVLVASYERFLTDHFDMSNTISE
jgi:pimeloyl-ACP methyl ester carboxylesterase